MTGQRRPTLVVDARMMGHSGIGTYLRNVLSGVFESGAYHVTLMGDRELFRKFGVLEKAGHIPLSFPIYHPGEQLELALRIPACDLFWSPHFNVPLLPIRAQSRISTIHDAYHLAHPEAFGRLSRTYARILFKGAAFRSDRIITVSEFSRGEIIRHAGGTEKIKVIPNGVDPEFARGFDKTAMPDQYILFVGNVKPHKNLRTLLRAFSLLSSDFPNLKLYAVGRTEGLLSPDSDVRALVEALPEGRAKLLGEVSLQQLKNYYANAAIFVFPSIYEGFGLPVLEAMTFGLPIAASMAGPMKEVGGDSIAYFDPTDAEDMARTIAGVLRNPAPGREAAYAERIGKFTWSGSVESHLQAFEEALSGAGGKRP